MGHVGKYCPGVGLTIMGDRSGGKPVNNKGILLSRKKTHIYNAGKFKQVKCDLWEKLLLRGTPSLVF